MKEKVTKLALSFPAAKARREECKHYTVYEEKNTHQFLRGKSFHDIYYFGMKFIPSLLKSGKINQ